MSSVAVVFFEDLAGISEARLLQLERDRVSENLTLEFKGQLDLDKEKAKREAAKDCSAFANAVGGQILYGISEKTLPDGSKVAGPIKPLSEGNIDERLANILASAVFPPLRPSMRKIQVAGGFVLAVEVARSPLDLHMVTAYEEGRYYRRGEKGALPMTEPEVREAYARIAASRTSLEERLDTLIRPELDLRRQTDESFIVAPWFSSRNLLDPQVLGELGRELYDVFGQLATTQCLLDLRLEAEGYRVSYPAKRPRQEAAFYLAILRSGVIHLSDDSALEWTSDKNEYLLLRSLALLYRLATYLMAAQHVYARVRYWAEARVLYEIRPRVPLFIDPDSTIGAQAIPPQAYRFGPVDVSLRQTGKRLGLVLQPLLDGLFQTRGVLACPYFDEKARLRDAYRARFPAQIVESIG